ncbi:isoprenylcysteine carboxylmethyltransferase family protein [Guyparkeria hydrothermalis]|uniref:methyltransferase family protein n=1 Tax=Guyparkeria TaxID=2035712 RepID=UPI0010AD9E7C|nr:MULTISPECIES: isoprenylcysteine carboxylmethyltransferase family protein [Guyparkeria]MCL7751502.1 isoprenylcysteine carboxylmethyltransferase family protein [Guyparkeria hydrothermalis]TKA88711.1 isoprenylcysteine carboxylmethyltransferase family protein [Guyparkeria sp. SB14A]
MLTKLIPPPVALLIAIALVYALATLWPGATLDWPWLTWLAWGLFATGGLLMLAAVISLAQAHTTINPIHPERTRHLVTSGIYRLSRNPIYLGDALLLAGVVCWFGHPAGVLAIAAFVGFIDRFQIRGEERVLTQRFGAGYSAYRARTRRWI